MGYSKCSREGSHLSKNLEPLLSTKKKITKNFRQEEFKGKKQGNHLQLRNGTSGNELF